MSTLRPAEVFPPGEFITDELNARGWGTKQLAERSGLAEVVVRKILDGQRKITPGFALCLGEAFGVSRDVFLNLQRSWDERNAT